MVKRGPGSASSPTTGTLKSPSSALTSKPDKDKDADKKNEDSKRGGTTDKSSLKAGKGSFRQVLTKRDLKALQKAKALGGQAWESTMAQVRLKLTPTIHKSMSARANTAMPCKKLKVRLQESVPKNKRVTTEAGIALAAVLDYAVSELMDNACQAADGRKQKTITPRHIKLGVPQDDSLAVLFRGVTIPQGGTVPEFHPELAQGYRQRKKVRRQEDEELSKELSSPSYYNSGGKKGTSEQKPGSSGDENSSIAADPKKDKPGASSSSPAEK